MQYETVIGLEIHVQLATRSKAFCADDASFGGAPNTHTSAISLAHPGTLPRLNKMALEYAVRLGLALGCDIHPRSTFDRKNYFYADLPKGFQTTQQNNPVCVGGGLRVEGRGWRVEGRGWMKGGVVIYPGRFKPSTLCLPPSTFFRRKPDQFEVVPFRVAEVKSLDTGGIGKVVGQGLGSGADV